MGAPKELDEDQIPVSGIMPIGKFFTASQPKTFFTCLWQHLKEKNVTPEVSEEDWIMNFEVPDDILQDKFV